MNVIHARLSASAAHRWLRCAGSVNLAMTVAEKQTVYAAEGERAHAWAASRLDGQVNFDELGEVPDDEMSEAINLYVNTVRADEQPDDLCFIEMPLLDALLKIDPDFGGTADAVRYRASDHSLRVFDFKYGQGVYVDVDDNEQLKMYALGTLLAINQLVHTVTVTIVQPRYEGAQPVRDYTFKASDLVDWAADLQEAAMKTRRPNPEFHAGEWCKFCKAARICPELEKHMHAITKMEFGNVQTYDPKQLAEGLRLIPLVKERIKAMEEFAYSEAVQGRVAPGFKLVDKRATRKWKNIGDVEVWCEQIAVEAYAPRELLSPAQLEKKLKKNEKEEMKQFVESVSSGTALVPADDVRPQTKLISDASDFEILKS